MCLDPENSVGENAAPEAAVPGKFRRNDAAWRWSFDSIPETDFPDEALRRSCKSCCPNNEEATLTLLEPLPRTNVAAVEDEARVLLNAELKGPSDQGIHGAGVATGAGVPGAGGGAPGSGGAGGIMPPALLWLFNK